MKSKDKSGAAEQESLASEDKLVLLSAEEEPASSHFGARLRGYFLTGLIVVGPVAITLYVVWWFINLVDAWVKPIIPKSYLPETYLPFNVPGVGLIVGIFGLMVVGLMWCPALASTSTRGLASRSGNRRAKGWRSPSACR